MKWFHRPITMDDWLLYAQKAFSVENGRGTAVGRFFTIDGMHRATVVEQGMVRAAGAGTGARS